MPLLYFMIYSRHWRHYHWYYCHYWLAFITPLLLAIAIIIDIIFTPIFIIIIDITPLRPHISFIFCIGHFFIIFDSAIFIRLFIIILFISHIDYAITFRAISMMRHYAIIDFRWHFDIISPLILIIFTLLFHYCHWLFSLFSLFSLPFSPFLRHYAAFIMILTFIIAAISPSIFIIFSFHAAISPLINDELFCALIWCIHYHEGFMLKLFFRTITLQPWYATLD